MTTIDLSTPVKGVEFRWSSSRGYTYEECKRKYWLHYFAADKYEEIKRLSGLSALPLWAGVLAHDSIEAYLRTHDKIIGPAEQEKLIHQITHGQMPQDWQYSLAGIKKFRLWEHEYAQEVDSHRKKVTMGIVAESMRAFFRGRILAEMMEVGRKNWLSIEDSIKIDLAPGYPINVKMDAAYRHGGLVKVVDWKTGARMADENQHQIVAYALVAIMLGWAKTPEEIETTLAYLVLGEEKSRRMSWEVIERSREKIIKACDAMRENVSVGPDGLQEAVGEEFPQCGVTWKCRNCKFRRVCFPNWSGKAAVSPASDAQRAG